MNKDWTITHLTDPSVNLPAHNLNHALTYITGKKGRVVYIDHLRQEVMFSDYPRHNPTARAVCVPPISRDLLVR